jgi:hypothetical protein
MVGIDHDQNSINCNLACGLCAEFDPWKLIRLNFDEGRPLDRTMAGFVFNAGPNSSVLSSLLVFAHIRVRAAAALDDHPRCPVAGANAFLTSVNKQTNNI